MSDIKIIDFTPVSDGQANDDGKLMAWGHPTSGELYRPTVAQAKKVFGTFRKKYVATGSEGTTLTISEIAAMEVLAIFREGPAIYEVDSDPDPAEFIWDNTTITLGLATNPGERFLILYKNY